MGLFLTRASRNIRTRPYDPAFLDYRVPDLVIHNSIAAWNLKLTDFSETFERNFSVIKPSFSYFFVICMIPFSIVLSKMRVEQPLKM